MNSRFLILFAFIFGFACNGEGVSSGITVDGGTGDAGDAAADADSGVLECIAGDDRDGDGIADFLDGPGEDVDSDRDGVSDADEARSSDPCEPADTDQDGLYDFLDPDSDNDGLGDRQEVELGTDPTLIDSDGDGVTDFGETQGTGTDPNDRDDTIPEGDFFVVLPFDGPRENRPLDFGSNIQIADVFFLQDTTSSMDEERTNLINGLQTIATDVQGRIPDVHFGAGGYDDYPAFIYGANGREDDPALDVPFYMLRSVAPFEEDLGAWSVPADANTCPQDPSVRDIGTLEGVPNGTADLFEAVAGLPCHSGIDAPESGSHALWSLATGNGLDWREGGNWPAGAIPAGSCPDGRVGYACFRPGALPIIMLIGDARLHDGPGEADPYNPLFVNGPDYNTARDALLGIGARVLGVFSDETETLGLEQFRTIATDTGAVRQDGSPLVFEINADGTGLSTSVVDAIVELVTTTPQDVGTRTENTAGNPDDVDATRFIKAVVPVSGDPSSGVAATNGTTFEGVIPGTRLTFRVEFENDFRQPSVPEIFRAKIVVVGNGVADLDSRDVWIVVPPSGQIILI